MNVTVVWATLTVQDVVAVEVPRGATVAEAVEKSGLIAQYGLDAARLGFASGGRRIAADAPLADGDRIDLTRPLEIDPKAARLARARSKPLAKASRRRRARRPT